VALVVCVQFLHSWAPLRATPKWSTVFVLGIRWVHVQPILDSIIEVIVKLINGHLHACFKVVSLLDLYHVVDSLQALYHLTSILVLLHLLDELLWVLYVLLKVIRHLNEQFIELVSTPFNAVFDLVREVSQGAHWN
jgi:hypothetical protein